MIDSIRCLVVDDDPMNLRIMQGLIEKTEGLELAGLCSSAAEAYNQLKAEEIDLVFLDVEMPEMTGLELVETLAPAPKIVLVTSKEKYAVPAFDLNITDYILKPIDYPRFLKAVGKVTKELQAEENSPEMVEGKLFVKVDAQLVAVAIDDIVMVEAMADYARIHTSTKRLTVYSSMKGISKKLPTRNFMRVHRSYIVNLNKVDAMEDNTLVLGAHMVPVGVTYQKALSNRLNML